MYTSKASFLQAVEDIYAEFGGDGVELVFETSSTLTFRSSGRDVTIGLAILRDAYSGGKVPNELFKARWKLDLEFSIQRGLGRFTGRSIVSDILAAG